MSSFLTRRRFLTGTAAAALTASASGAAALIGKRYGLVPPDHSGLFGAGETLTYATQRMLLYRQPLAREFKPSQISKNFQAINTILPEDDSYRQDMAGGFEKWRLNIDGMVARPREFSLAELKRFPTRTQITQHICEQG